MNFSDMLLHQLQNELQVFKCYTCAVQTFCSEIYKSLFVFIHLYKFFGIGIVKGKSSSGNKCFATESKPGLYGGCNSRKI